MNGKLAFVIYRDGETRRRLSEALSRAGLKVLGARSGRAALERLDELSYLLPDVILTPLAEAAGDDASLLSQLRASPRTRAIPIVILGENGPEERRHALRLGLPHLISAPHHSEELLLTVRLALEQDRDERHLSGSLAQLSLPDLLQTIESSRQSGTVRLRHRGQSSTLWLREGRVIDAETEGGLRGQEAVYAVAAWDEGSFKTEFGPVAVPERIFESTSFLLLEAMRRRDEQRRRDETPPYAALPDPPPAPPRAVLATHRALTLITVAAAYASEHLESSLLRERLERHRRSRLTEHPALALFTPEAAGASYAIDPEKLGELNAEAMVLSVAEWLRGLFVELEGALPGRFSVSKLKALTEAVGDDLEDLGFYSALGLVTETREDTT